MTVKVHYSTTRALRLSSTSSYNQLEEAICNKFSVPQGSLTLWSIKKNGDRKEVANEIVYKQVVKNLDDGFRLTLWAYDKHEVQCVCPGIVSMFTLCYAVIDLSE